jgi:hypothetical protein
MVGKTQNAGWQVGIRKTFSATSDQLWNFIVSTEGMGFMVGESILAENIYKQDRTSKTNIQYKITTMVQNSHLRMQWRQANWEEYSILQIRVYTSGKNKAVLAIHQEKLGDENTRAFMKKYWQEKMDFISENLQNRQE